MRQTDHLVPGSQSSSDSAVSVQPSQQSSVANDSQLSSTSDEQHFTVSALQQVCQLCQRAKDFASIRFFHPSVYLSVGRVTQKHVGVDRTLSGRLAAVFLFLLHADHM